MNMGSEESTIQSITMVSNIPNLCKDISFVRGWFTCLEPQVQFAFTNAVINHS